MRLKIIGFINMEYTEDLEINNFSRGLVNLFIYIFVQP